MVMQVFRGGDDGDDVQVDPSPTGSGTAVASKKSGRRWFFDAAPQTPISSDNQSTSRPAEPHFLKFAARKPAFDFSEPRPA